MSEKCTRGELKKKRFKEQFLTFYVSFHFSIGSRSLACTEAFNAYIKKYLLPVILFFDDLNSGKF